MGRKRDTSRPVLHGPGGTAYLTPRQSEVLELSARGLGDKEIAAQLGISPRTVVDRFAELRQRTGARTRAELVARAAEAGLLQLAPQQRRPQDPPHLPSPVPVTSSGVSRAGAGRPGQGEGPRAGWRPAPWTAGKPTGPTSKDRPQHFADQGGNDWDRVQAGSRPGPSAGAEPLVSMQEVLDALHKVRGQRDRLDDAERALIDMARRHGVTWPRIARALGAGSAQAAQQRRKLLGGPPGR